MSLMTLCKSVFTTCSQRKVTKCPNLGQNPYFLLQDSLFDSRQKCVFQILRIKLFQKNFSDECFEQIENEERKESKRKVSPCFCKINEK